MRVSRLVRVGFAEDMVDAGCVCVWSSGPSFCGCDNYPFCIYRTSIFMTGQDPYNHTATQHFLAISDKQPG